MKFGASVLFAATVSVQQSEVFASDLAANPIRKVVTMLQAIQKKVSEEGERGETLHKKYMCYCSNAGGDLKQSIAAAETKAPELQAAIQESTAQELQLSEDLKSHKGDREAAKSALEEAAAIRNKEAAAYAATKAEYGANIGALEKAISALEKGMVGSFFQSSSASVLRNLVRSNADLDESDRKDILAFLADEHHSQYAPQSGQVVGILKQMLDEMGKGLAEATAAEEAAIKSHGELSSAKAKEIEALTSAIEGKSVRKGELAVSLANMKNDLDDSAAALEEDTKFLADLSANCDKKSAEWVEIQKVRAEEQAALAETIRILQDDDSLELFKQTLPSPSVLMQLDAQRASRRTRALAALGSTPKFDFIELALRHKKGGFESVIAMVDEMVAILKREQEDDDAKISYCSAEFDSNDDKKKSLELSISDSEKAIESAEQGIASLAAEIKALTDGVAELDKNVAAASSQRKAEHEEYQQMIAQDSAAKKLLGVAKNRLNQFYNPKLHVAPPARKLTEEERIYSNFGGTLEPTPAPGGIAGTGIAVLAQVHAHAQKKDAPAPPPESFGPYSKKTEESTGVIALLDRLIDDLTKEMTVAETEEKNAQTDYEKAMIDSSNKRSMDSKSIEDKQAAKANTEAALQAHKDDKASSSRELNSILETIAGLHAECDWLTQYHQTRKEARSAELDSLNNAKAVLSGADFSLLQTATRQSSQLQLPNSKGKDQDGDDGEHKDDGDDEDHQEDHHEDHVEDTKGSSISGATTTFLATTTTSTPAPTSL